MSEVALFGGSFNPPHSSHLGVLAHLTGPLDFERVWMIPAFRHPFGKPLAPFEDRVAMCRLMAAHFGGRVEVSEIERDLGGTGHTVETLRALAERHPDTRFRLVLGSDILGEIDRWRSFEEIARLASILWIPRRGCEPENRLLGREAFLDEVSSTEIRERSRSGLPVEGLVPEEVARYIAERGLYRTG